MKLQSTYGTNEPNTQSQVIPRSTGNNNPIQNSVVAESAADDLDSSNVLYDDDFEIEEESKNNF